ncbi:hypothetical protein ABB55_08330 [Prosthecomicrobium hirschii]|uniref:Glucose/Sorbosone dehydrogenase domain-containing protein n=1 Tax=Prosthecodimorpha hirschii TaxID=665126 RepID=A0A0P6WC58_9HYPH|nr:PQQ-dependent sugar dehydrogenase [Prosthecomicrobium hirschii]KPL52239.1 hypothetical protein ABB55_08330 [Prosthecomicrobium hirschii]
MRVTTTLSLAAMLIAATVTAATPTDAPRITTEKATITATVVASGLDHPWGIAILPDGRMLITERSGRMRIFEQNGKPSKAITGLPKVDARDQGGLLDVAIDPDFARNGLVYWSYAEAGPGGNSTAVARGRLNAKKAKLDNVQVIFSQKPKVASTLHFGSRLVFDRTGALFITLGERFDYTIREKAQTLDSDIGKVVRITPAGDIPNGNPFTTRPGALPEIWSLGHRNAQAAALNPNTGDLWVIEHGPLGGDEINIAKAGLNFGWPVVSFGKNYDGTPVGTGLTEAPGMTQPIYQWTPVIAPSGMIFHSGRAFPGWKGNLFVGGLKTRVLVRLELSGNTVVKEERILGELGARIRDVAEGADGHLWIITDDANGKLVRVKPAT